MCVVAGWDRLCSIEPQQERRPACSHQIGRDILIAFGDTFEKLANGWFVRTFRSQRRFFSALAIIG